MTCIQDEAQRADARFPGNTYVCYSLLLDRAVSGQRGGNVEKKEGSANRPVSSDCRPAERQRPLAGRSALPPVTDRGRHETERDGETNSSAPVTRQLPSGGASPPAVVRQAISGYRFVAMCQQRQQRLPVCLRVGHGSATPPATFLLRF